MHWHGGGGFEPRRTALNITFETPHRTADDSPNDRKPKTSTSLTVVKQGYVDTRFLAEGEGFEP